MSASEFRLKQEPPGLFYFEQLVIFCIVWHYWSWDVALITAIASITLLTYIGSLELEATNIFCQLAGIVYGAFALFILLKVQASLITCLVFVPMAAAIGYAVHLAAIAHQGIKLDTAATGEPS